MVMSSAISNSSWAHVTRHRRGLRWLPPRETPASRGAARLRYARNLAGEIPSVQQARDRALLADPPDRLGDQRRDRELADIARDPHGLGREDAIGHHQLLQRRCGD